MPLIDIHETTREGPYLYRRNDDNNGWTTIYSETVPVGDYSSSMDRVDTPNFHKKLKSGAVLPFNFYRRESSHNDGDFRFLGGGGSGSSLDRYEGAGRFTPGPGPLSLPGMVDHGDLIQAAAAKLYSQGHDSLTFLVELKKLRTLHLQSSRSLLNIVRAIRRAYSSRSNRRLFKEGVSLLDAISDAWLTGRYGIRTLWYDLDDLYAATIAFEEKAFAILHERTGYSTSGSSVDVFSQWISPPKGEFGSLFGTVQLSRNTSWKVSMRGMIAAKFDSPRFQFNPITTAWELTPWSFVLDWLFTVGKTLEAASLVALAQDLQAGKGTLTEYSYSVTDTGTTLKAPYFIDSIRYYASGAGVVKARDSASVPLLPRIYPRFSVGKATDLLALVYGVIRRK